MRTYTLQKCVLIISIFLVGSVSGQEGARQNSTPKKPTPAAKKVGFRLAKWRTIHGDGTPATQKTVETLQKIGCEVRQSNHAGHVDVSFRCPGWKMVNVKDDKQSQQWHEWLVSNEFETVVLNPAADVKLPTVRVRMVAWKTIHARSAQQAQSLKETYELIGCEARIENHGNHIDLKFRCPTWNTIALPNSKAAHAWQDWLNKSGFETEHDHSADHHDAHAGHNHAAGSHTGNNHHGHDH